MPPIIPTSMFALPTNEFEMNEIIQNMKNKMDQ